MLVVFPDLCPKDSSRSVDAGCWRRASPVGPGLGAAAGLRTGSSARRTLLTPCPWDS